MSAFCVMMPLEWSSAGAIWKQGGAGREGNGSTEFHPAGAEWNRL